MGETGSVTTALDLALRHPRTHGVEVTVAQLRDYLARPKSHVALVVDADGRLVATVLPEDLPAADDAAPGMHAGTLEGRTVAPTTPAAEVEQLLETRGLRRLAVVDAEGRLLGLVCRKRRSSGFCDDAGVAALRAERQP